MTAKSKSLGTRDTLAKVRDHIESVESRLKKASKANDRAVSALQASFESLSQRSGAQADTLKLHTDKLATHLNNMIAQTRSDISKDLKTALANPRMDVITSAVSQANNRLMQAETRQAEAIQKVNQQIARLASALDARLLSETEARKALDVRLTDRMDAITNSNSARFTDIEAQTATAVSDIGERIVVLSDELNKRAELMQEITLTRLDSTAAEAQQELEAFKSEIEHRVESSQEETRDRITPLSRQIATLSARLEAVELGVASGVTTAPSNALPPFPVAPSLAAAPTGKDVDAFTPEPETVLEEPIPAPSPKTPLNANTPDTPVEFMPEIYAEPLTPNAHKTQNNIMPFAAPESNIQGQPMTANQLGHDTSTQSYTHNPYEAPLNDPNAYQPLQPLGRDDSMSAARPATQNVGKSPLLSKRMLRTGASAAAIVAIATFGGLMVKNKIMGSSTPDIAQIGDRVQQVAGNSDSAPWQTAGSQPEISEKYDVTLQTPTGQIASTDGTVSQISNAVNAEPKTLDAAVETGNSVAQLQKGLALMQEGRKEDAASLIRLAANQGQPAAQYYLGHMYENGDGLAADSTQARKLTEMAAKSGHRIAMYDVALYYIEGKGGVDVNMNTAAQWFRKAAEFGMVDAQYNLAVLHERGTGVPLDLAESYVWFTIAGRNGDQDSAQRAEQLKMALEGDSLGRAEARIAGFKPSQINEEVNGIFTNLAWQKPAPARDEQVVKVQEWLGALGYSAGVADGAMGPNTRNAIKTFERENGMPERGVVSEELIQRLSTVSGA